MSSIYVCFNLKSDSYSFESTETLDNIYQDVFSPIGKFLYKHPEFSFAFSFSGNQINYFKKRKNEFISVIKELSQRKQIEIFGGGYYDPILPLVYNLDRVEQVDLLSAEIRQTFGKRPRGITLFADCWDSSLISSLQTCSIEYVLLDSSTIPTTKQKFLPISMAELNKIIEIYPTYDELKPEKDITPEIFINNILSKITKIEKKDTYCQLIPDRIINIKLTFEDFIQLNKKKWFEKLADYIKSQENSRIKISTISQFKKNANFVKCNAFIPAGISWSIAKWIDNNNKHNNYTVYDFMEKYPQSRSLYNRIMFTNMLINQYKEDKIRKRSAREKLWQAQNGTGLLCNTRGAFQNSKYRQQAYKTLSEAEKILRDETSFKESILNFDYDSDGVNEYICRMKNYFSYISTIGGSIQELEVIKNTGNYCDNLSRQLEFDGFKDNYSRGLFIDHIFTKQTFDNYLANAYVEDGVFSSIQYQELKYSHNRHEISMFADAYIKATKQKISLKKKYIVNSDGMNIQYILKNESEKTLDVKFAIESNFAHTNFNEEKLTFYELDVIDNNQKIVLDPSKSTGKLNAKNKMKYVDAIRITDVQSGVSFGFEPNESCSYYYNPILFKRPDFMTNKIVPVSMTFVSTLYWDIKLEPGKETERTINFTITPVKKEKPKIFGNVLSE